MNRPGWRAASPARPSSSSASSSIGAGGKPLGRSSLLLTARRAASRVPFTVSLFNWRAAEWQAWEVGAGSSIVPDGERYISATGEVRLRYTLDASLASTVREVRLNRLDVTAVGSIR